ncbi:MAG: sensor domain-containing diguanylate cyclase [Thermodesulfobacteriota bacterium]
MDELPAGFDLQELFLHFNTALYFVDTQRRITYWNKAAEQVTGYTADEVVGAYCYDNILGHVDAKGCSLCTGKCPLAHSLSDGVAKTADVYLHHKEGHRIPVHVRITPLKNLEGQIIGATELFLDTTAQAALEKRVEDLEGIAMIDELTRLPNRKLITSELDACFKQLQRKELIFGVIFLDIDNFKHFNDTHGHLTGDRLLMTVAATLESVSRPYDIFGRWGGEEFVGIIKNVNRQALGRIADRYRVLLEQSTIRIAERFIGATVSIGATTARPGDSIDAVLNRADRYMYRSKHKGKNMVTIDESE